MHKLPVPLFQKLWYNSDVNLTRQTLDPMGRRVSLLGDDDMTHYKKRKQKSTAAVVGTWILIIVLGVLLAGYLFVAAYYHKHFYYGSRINQIDYSGKTVEEVEKSIAEEIASYTVHITGRNGVTAEITAEDMGYHYVSDGQIQKLKDKQNPFQWPLSFFSSEEEKMEATCEYDQELLLESIDSLPFFDPEQIEPPEDAYLDFEEDTYVIVPEKKGTTLDAEKVRQVIRDAIDMNAPNVNLEEAGCYLAPSITSKQKDITKACKLLNRYGGVTITYDFGDRTEILGPETIREWISVDEDFKVIINEDKIMEYVNYLGYYYTTFSSTREFVRYDGKTIKVKGGDYGWIINRPEEAVQLKKVIQAGKSVTREPVYSQTAVSRNKNDIGSTYIEVNLRKQHLWLFVDGKKIMDSKIVTGNTSRGYDTPAGIYAITYKERDATLVGENYASPVKYWMPFNMNIGFHDANWRNKFGGNLYKTQGSHGCVNMPPAKAKKLYENIQKGTPVVVY